MANDNDVIKAILGIDEFEESERILGKNNPNVDLLAMSFKKMKEDVLMKYDETHYNVSLKNALRIISDCGFDLICSYPVGDPENNIFYVFYHEKENYLTIVESYNWGRDLLSGKVNRIESYGFRYVSWDEYRIERGFCRPNYSWKDERDSSGWCEEGWGRALFGFSYSGHDGARRKHYIATSHGLAVIPWPIINNEKNEKCLYAGRLSPFRCMLTFADHRKNNKYDILLSRMRFIPEKYWDALNIRDLLE